MTETDRSLDAADRRLLAAADEVWQTAVARAGRWCVCRVGCSDCCHGPFPITQLDAHRLRRSLDELRRTDPAAAAAIVDRARHVMAQMASSRFDDVATGTRADDRAVQERYGASLGAVPCPALHPETDACELYAGRPMACRTYGPPTVTGAQRRHPCRLWFDGARPEDVERCRVRFGGEEAESELVDRAEGSGQRCEPTIIAAVLAE